MELWWVQVEGKLKCRGFSLRVTVALRGYAQFITPFFVRLEQDLIRCVIKNFCNDRRERKHALAILHILHEVRTI